MALRPRTYKCAFPDVPEHTFELTWRVDSEFCPEHRQAGERRRRALSLAARDAKVKAATVQPPSPDTGLLCRTCGRRPSGPLCYECFRSHSEEDESRDFARLPQPSPNAPQCGLCKRRPRNPFCDRCIHRLLGIWQWD